jgi:hypothetical protein
MNVISFASNIEAENVLIPIFGRYPTLSYLKKIRECAIQKIRYIAEIHNQKLRRRIETKFLLPINTSIVTKPIVNLRNIFPVELIDYISKYISCPQPSIILDELRRVNFTPRKKRNIIFYLITE